MRCALPDRMAPDQMGYSLGRAHHYRTTNHYRTPSMKIEAPPHAGGTLLPQARPRETQMRSLPGEIIGPPESIESLRHQETGKEAKGCPM